MFIGEGNFNNNMINDCSLFVPKNTQTSPVCQTVSQVSSVMRGSRTESGSHEEEGVTIGSLQEVTR